MADVFYNFINGAPLASEDSDVFTRANPADEHDVIGEFPDSDESEVARAVVAAKNASPAWRKLSPDARAQFLYRAADILERRKSDVAAALTREEGKSLAESAGET
ncbi:MAG: aldehyde dehydrogenase family protein, partial [Fibrella sp.]|nr:aldehyde dehydrogenase family protein [Armatimonadota bacterium]